MADVLSKGTNFPAALIPDLVQATMGHSAIARLCGQKPLAFNGNTEFTFSLDKEVDLVAENGAFSKGGATLTPVTVVPYKVEYGLRVSDEFMYANEEVQLNYMKSFTDGFARKLGRGLDLMAAHGWNPRTLTASTVIGTNHFDSVVDQIETIATGDTADANIEAAIALVQGSDFDVTGLFLSNTFKGELAAMVGTDGHRIYPDLAWGAAPGAINGLKTESNSTLSANSSKDRALVGDFQNFFRWGIARNIPLEVIQYGNPDNDSTLGDLKGHGQVYLRATAYIGYGIVGLFGFALFMY